MCDCEFSIGNCFNKERINYTSGSYLALLQVVLKLKSMMHFVVCRVRQNRYAAYVLRSRFVLKVIMVEIPAGMKVILGRHIQIIPKVL